MDRISVSVYHTALIEKMAISTGIEPVTPSRQRRAFKKQREENGDLDRNRTCNPLLRRQMLYPVELRDRLKLLSIYTLSLDSGGVYLKLST